MQPFAARDLSGLHLRYGLRGLGGAGGSTRYRVRTQKLLETFQTHPGVEKLGGECVAKTMDSVMLLIQPCLLEIVHEMATTSTSSGVCGADRV